MSDVIAEVARIKADTVERDLALHAIRVLAKNDALDLAPMLFAPLGPTYDHDAWRRKQKREGK